MYNTQLLIKMTGMDIALLVFIVIALIIFGLYKLNKWAYGKMDQQQSLINSQKMTQTIYVIDKKRDKITNVNMPKVVMDNLPKRAKLMKMCFVKAKIGPQFMTFICDKPVFEAIPVKANVKADIAGMYIVDFAGYKTKEEMKEKEKAKKSKEKEEKKNEKKNKKK